MCYSSIIADLCPAKKKKTKTVEQENEEWREKYGEEGARLIRSTVDANIPDYEYMKSFAVKAPFKAPGKE